MSEESHFEVRRARELLDRWRERAARQQANKAKEHRPTFDEEQYQKDIGYLLLVIKNLESGYYARPASTTATMKKTEEEIEDSRRDFRTAVRNAKATLKPGDRIRVTKCPGTKRTITFAHWDGDWIVSKSGIDDYAASCIDRVNGKPVDFKQPQP